MHKESVISINDLRYVCIQCPHCKARVTLDMQQKTELLARHGFFAPKQCPGCQTDYDTAIQAGVDQLQKAYQALAAVADRITFRAESSD